jgi:hypothetical protein
MLLFYFFEASKKITVLSAEVEVLKKNSNAALNMSHTEILDALSAELKARREASQKIAGESGVDSLNTIAENTI